MSSKQKILKNTDLLNKKSQKNVSENDNELLP